jgi:hypothetical protein
VAQEALAAAAERLGLPQAAAVLATFPQYLPVKATMAVRQQIKAQHLVLAAAAALAQ